MIKDSYIGEEVLNQYEVSGEVISIEEDKIEIIEVKKRYNANNEMQAKTLAERDGILEIKTVKPLKTN